MMVSLDNIVEFSTARRSTSQLACGAANMNMAGIMWLNSFGCRSGEWQKLMAKDASDQLVTKGQNFLEVSRPVRQASVGRWANGFLLETSPPS